MYNDSNYYMPYIEYFETRNTDTDSNSNQELISENCEGLKSKEECTIKINKVLQDRKTEADRLYNILFSDNTSNPDKKKMDTIEYLKNVQLKFTNTIPENQKEYETHQNDDKNRLYHLKNTADRTMDAYFNINIMPEQKLTDSVNDFYNNMIDVKPFDTSIFDTYINILIDNINSEISNPDIGSPIQLDIKKIDDLYDTVIYGENILNESITKIKGYDFSNLDNLLNLSDFYSSVEIIASEKNRISSLIEKNKNTTILPINEITDEGITQEINTIKDYIESISSLIYTLTRCVNYIKKTQELANKIIQVKLSDILLPINLRIFESTKLYNQLISSYNTLQNSIVEIKRYYNFNNLQDFYSSVDELENNIKIINTYKQKIDNVTELITVDIQDYQDTLSSLIEMEKSFLKAIVPVQDSTVKIINESFSFSFLLSIVVIILLMLFAMVWWFFLRKK